MTETGRAPGMADDGNDAFNRVLLCGFGESEQAVFANESDAAPRPVADEIESPAHLLQREAR